MMETTTPTWQHTARVRLQRIKTTAESARVAYVAAADAATAAGVDAARAETKLRELQTPAGAAGKSDLQAKVITSQQSEVDALNAAHEETRAVVAELGEKSTAAAAVAKHAQAAFDRVNGVTRTTGYGG
jgi:hypothetical protein